MVKLKKYIKDILKRQFRIKSLIGSCAYKIRNNIIKNYRLDLPLYFCVSIHGSGKVIRTDKVGCFLHLPKTYSHVGGGDQQGWLCLLTELEITYI